MNGFYQVNRVSKAGHRKKPEFNPKDPRGIAVCDGCSFLVQHDSLREQLAYRGGSSPVGTGLFVCPTCYDQLQPYFKKQVLPADPVPLKNPRPDTQATNTQYETYLLADLPNPYDYPAGYPVNVIILGETVRAYGDTINWRIWDTNEVIA